MTIPVGDVVHVRERARLLAGAEDLKRLRCPESTLRIRSGTACAMPGSASGTSPGP